MKTTFRFETLEVWRRSADLSMQVFQLADELERQKQFRFAEQLRAAMLSITNNLAEGSGSSSKREFSQFVNISRRSLFEVVNMLLIFSRHGLVDRERIEPWLAELEELSKMLEALRKKLSSVMTQLLALLMPLLSFGT
ncbi:MAG: four helix bundle protein [Verrucomicrobiaceae bacterium]|nr:four helix bundle protein [Verrucomicrobiaceae bacterium]